MTISIDLSKRAWTRARGDLTAIGAWLSIGGRFRPCMVLIRTGDELSEHAVPCIITMDKAWIWSEEVGDMALAADILAGFLRALRLSPDRRDTFRVLSLIRDHLGDLLTIPPYRPEQGGIAAELTVTERETGSVREVEIREDV